MKQEIKEQLDLSKEATESRIFLGNGVLVKNFDPKNPKPPLQEDIIAKIE
jgi:hypothetical protein